MTDVTSNEKYGDANPGNQQHGSQGNGCVGASTSVTVRVSFPAPVNSNVPSSPVRHTYAWEGSLTDVPSSAR